MNNRYFVNLAIQNISKHRQAYLPYMVVLCCFVAMFYIVAYLSQSAAPQMELGASVFNYLLDGAAYIFGAFAIVFLIYCNGYLLRPRTKEFGLLYLLGLSQWHMLLIMVFEIFIVFCISMGSGGLTGIIVSRLMSMVLAAFVKTPLQISQSISWSAVSDTLVLFVSIMCIIVLINAVEIVRSKPVSLLQKNVKTDFSAWGQRILLGVGVLCVVYSYVAVISMHTPQKAYELLAPAFVSVIIGTYCLFMSVSVLILRLLMRRPHIYYKTRNFITINWLLTRLQLNAVGLASISMFSLVMMIVVTMTAMIYLGTDESNKNMYGADITITVQKQHVDSFESVRKSVDAVVQSVGMQAQTVDAYEFLYISTRLTANRYEYEPQNRSFIGDNTSHLFTVISVDQYNKLYGEKLALKPNEVAVYSSYTELPQQFNLAGQVYTITMRLPKLSIANYDLDHLINAHYLIVHDASVLEYHAQAKAVLYPDFPLPIRYRLGTNLSGSTPQELEVYQSLIRFFKSEQASQNVIREPSGTTTWSVQSREAEKKSFQAVYGSLYFLGLFIGVIFIVSTAVLIYYKQIIDGYEDKQRFDIMQRIGMTREEVRQSVDKQIVFLFFIPLIVAGGHFLISLNMMRYLLELFRIYNISMLLLVALLTLLLFSLIYALIYRVSVRVYYNIVR